MFVLDRDNATCVLERGCRCRSVQDADSEGPVPYPFWCVRGEKAAAVYIVGAAAGHYSTIVHLAHYSATELNCHSLSTACSSNRQPRLLLALVLGPVLVVVEPLLFLTLTSDGHWHFQPQRRGRYTAVLTLSTCSTVTRSQDR